MRLYVENPETKEHVHLQVFAKSRRDLVAALGAQNFVVQGRSYSVNDVKAERRSDNAVVSALIGGLIGVIGGGAGLVAGSAIGALIGGIQNDKERAEAEKFNRSSI
jgi:uncharacterized protein YcfJ